MIHRQFVLTINAYHERVTSEILNEMPFDLSEVQKSFESISALLDASDQPKDIAFNNFMTDFRRRSQSEYRVLYESLIQLKQAEFLIEDAALSKSVKNWIRKMANGAIFGDSNYAGDDEIALSYLKSRSGNQKKKKKSATKAQPEMEWESAFTSKRTGEPGGELTAFNETFIQIRLLSEGGKGSQSRYFLNKNASILLFQDHIKVDALVLNIGKDRERVVAVGNVYSDANQKQFVPVALFLKKTTTGNPFDMMCIVELKSNLSDSNCSPESIGDVKLVAGNTLIKSYFVPGKDGNEPKTHGIHIAAELYTEKFHEFCLSFNVTGNSSDYDRGPKVR